MSRCAMCGGERAPGQTTYSVDLGSGVVVVRNVPAQVCRQCGEEWIDAVTAGKLEEIVARARQDRTEVEVVALG